MTVTFARFDGTVDWHEAREVSIAAGASACVWRLDALRSSPAHYLHIKSGTNVFPSNRHFFVDIKDLVRQPVAPAMSARVVTEHEVRVALQAPPDGYVYFAHDTSPHESTRFSDKYFDLVPAKRVN